MRFHFLIFLLCFATGFQALEIVNREASSRPDGLHPGVHGDRAGCHNTDSPHTALFGRIPRPGRIDTSIFRLTYLFGIHTRLQDGYFKPMLVNQLWIANFIQLNGATKPKNERLEAGMLSSSLHSDFPVKSYQISPMQIICSNFNYSPSGWKIESCTCVF